MRVSEIYSTSTTRSFEEVCERVKSKAGLDGFKVLQVHDMQTSLRKMGFEIERTVIVEVCNPALASEALSLETHTALLMPCRVVVQEEKGLVILSTHMPENLLGNIVLKETAHKIWERLLSLIDTAASTPSCCKI